MMQKDFFSRNGEDLDKTTYDMEAFFERRLKAQSECF